jgi:hypothetical protein
MPDLIPGILIQTFSQPLSSAQKLASGFPVCARANIGTVAIAWPLRCSGGSRG